ncbi:FUSC family protein [Mycobacterium sp.]|uniref:FUSC family protein n=1 Tax=Mycobacterium sp. TaxID=1785 RepID=UPI003A8C183C
MAAVRRLRTVLWPVAQTSVAAGLAWYITHDVLAHRLPFFAPVSAVVCMSATNVLRARRAIQMIVGVTLGIVIGGGLQTVLGSGPAAMAVVVFVALVMAVLLGYGVMGQGLVFANQTAVSAVLVVVFTRHGVVVFERLFDSLVGGCLAMVFSLLLFPADPERLLSQARASVLKAVHDTLGQTAAVLNGSGASDPLWQQSIFERLHGQVGQLIEARATADLVVRTAPRRWASRSTIREIDTQCARLGLFVDSVLHLARTVNRPLEPAVMSVIDAVLAALMAGTGLADSDPADAAAHVAEASRRAAELAAGARDSVDVVVADVVVRCAADLQAVVDRAVC